MLALSQGRETARPFRLAVLCLLGALTLLLALGGSSAEAKTKCTQKGTKGVDILKGTKHRDVLCGLGGADILLGKKGDDTLKGGGGKDVLLGADGADNLIAGGGSDSLTGGKGNDKIKGQGGSDAAAFSDAPGVMTINLPGKTATGNGNDRVTGIEKVIGSPANDVITGDGKANSITAGSGDDMITGGGGDDTLIGESGVDTLSYAGSPAGVSGGLDSGSMSGDGSDTVSGVEKLIGSSHDDTLVGDASNDTISGGAGDDHLSGGGGDDLLNGEDGNDEVLGEDANDSLHGDAGNDLIDGGAGVNACDGGTGANTFAGNCDAGPPTLSDLRIAPASVDTFASSRTIQLRLDVADDLAGVDPDSSKLIIHGPSGVDTQLDLSLITGNQSIGTLGTDYVLPRYAPAGTYAVDAVLVDENANSTTITSAQLITLGFDGSFSQTGQGDSVAPLVGGLTATPLSVDTSQQARDLHFVIHATDDLAGVDAGKSFVVAFAPDGTQRGLTFLADAGGTPVNGDFAGDITMPRYSPQGTYTLLLKLTDTAGNEAYSTSEQLIDKGYTGSFSQTGAGDTVPAQLLSFTRSPATTDTREGSQTLSISIGASDALSGVDPAASQVVIRDPNGRIDSTTPLVAAGTNAYTAAPVLARGSAPGIWKIDVILVDKAGNTTELPASKLSQLGFQSTFQNLAVQGT